MTATEEENQMAAEPAEETTTRSDEEKLSVYVPGPDAIDITPNKDGGVTKEIRQPGTGDAHPMTGDTVFVHYVGTLTDGTKFDSSRDRGEQFEFKLGTGNVIKAWDLGVATMKRGEIAVLLCKSDYAYGKTGSPPKIPGGATLVFEVELFNWKGEDVSENKDGGVTRRQLKAGEGYQTPKDGATCEIQIVGRHDGRQFENRDVTFVVGEGSEAGLVEGVEQGIKKFKKGEKSVLTVSSRYGYGDLGNASFNIPPNADLEYEIELKKFEKAKESWEMDFPEKLEQSEIYKNKGTDFFKAGKFQIATKYYKKIVDFLKDEESSASEDQAEKRKVLLLAAHLNSAMCYLKEHDDIEAIHSCDEALKLDPKNEKGLFRRGTANLSLQNFDEALVDFKAVLEVDPDNKAAKNQIVVANQKIKAVRQREKSTYAGMFQKFAAADAKKEALEPQKEVKSDADQTDDSETTTPEDNIPAPEESVAAA